MTEEKEKRFIAARRRYIESQFSKLNSQQQEAVLTTEGPLLLLAGAGSGKTTVLIHRIACLIRFGRAADASDLPASVTEEDLDFLENLSETMSQDEREQADALCCLDPAAPWSIIAITFTNKAAGELKGRLAEVVGRQADDVWAMTFHSACCRILRREIDRLGYRRSFTIYDTADSERIMKEILRDMGLDDRTFPVKSVLGYISRAKDQMQSVDEFAAAAQKSGDYRAERIAEAYGAYQKRLMENDAVDFDDIIFLTVRLLQEYEEVRSYYQRKFKYVLIDEYQDTNHAQYLLASLLAGKYKNICVVGDDDQSIYRFRGASIENILSFEQQFQNAKVIRLEQNYRSTQSILDAANAVISNNLGRKGKKLWTANGQGSPILLYDAFNETEEANFVAGQILSHSKGRGFKDFAILYRTNAQSNALENAMKRNGIPYRIIGGTRFFDRAEVKDMLAYMTVAVNQTDDLRMQRIINNPPRGIGAKTVETAQRMAAAEGLPLFAVVSDPAAYGPLERAVPKLLGFSALIQKLHALQGELQLPEFYDQMLKLTGYADMLREKPTEENKTRLENVQELKSSLISYMENTDAPTLAGFLEEIALYTDIEQYDADADAVVMMTMHSAKGLEFPSVFLVGLEDGLFPGMRAIGDPDEMEEERRLCYVAITRAKQSLTISHARQRMLYGRTNSCMPSRFLKEIPAECVTERGGVHTRPQAGLTLGGTGTTVSRKNELAARRKQAMKQSEYSAMASGIAAPVVDYRKGDMVQHSAFGKGMILSVVKAGGDALLEIAFDQTGTKRLMAKAASAHMKKL